jgi:hypothetical protein
MLQRMVQCLWHCTIDTISHAPGHLTVMWENSKVWPTVFRHSHGGCNAGGIVPYGGTTSLQLTLRRYVVSARPPSQAVGCGRAPHPTRGPPPRRPSGVR